MIRLFRGILNHQSNFASMAIARNLAYRSDLSLELLYPNSRQQIYTPSSPPV